MEQIESLLKRPAAYCNIDGVWELGMGVLCLAFFIFMWMQAHTSDNSLWHNPLLLLVYIAMVSAVLYFGMNFLKKRLTYPRTGFVTYRKSKLVWGVAIAFVVAPTVAAAAFYMTREPWDPTIPFFLIGSMLMAAVYAYRVALVTRWKWIVVAFMIIAAVTTAFLPATLLESLGGAAQRAGIGVLFGAILLFESVLSVLFLASGGISLYLYVHNTPLPGPGEE